MQIVGGIAGAMIAHLMFGLPLLDTSMKVRTGGAQWFAEAVAVVRVDRDHSCGAFALSARVCAVAGWPLHHSGLLVHRLNVVCQSGCNCGPCLLSNTFAGIRPQDVTPFIIVAELIGAVIRSMYVCRRFLLGAAAPTDRQTCGYNESCP